MLLFCFTFSIPTFADHSSLRNDTFNTLPDSNVATFPTNSQIIWDHEEAQREGRAHTPFIYSGGLHATSGSLTSPAFATEAFVPERVNQSSTAITYNAIANDVCWTIISSDNNGITGWTRVGSTSYYYQCEGDTTPNQPLLPPNSAWLMGPIRIVASAISIVRDKRIPASYVHAGVYDITDRLYGALADSTTDNCTAITTAVAALPEHWSGGAGTDTDIAGAGTVYIPPGVFRSSCRIDLYRRGMLFTGASGKLGSGSTLRFDAGVHGLLVTTRGVGTTVNPYRYGLHTQIQNLTITAVSKTTRANGISMTRTAHVQNVSVDGFAGDGIYIQGPLLACVVDPTGAYVDAALDDCTGSQDFTEEDGSRGGVNGWSLTDRKSVV